MALRLNLMAPTHPVQRRAIKRRGQLRAIVNWLQDLKDGQENISLKTYCEDQGVTSAGITKLLRDPKVSKMIETVTEETARLGSKLSTSLLVKRLEKEGKSMDTGEVVRVGEHLAKLKTNAYRRTEQSHGAQVLVNINLPEGGYDKPIRVEAVEKAKENLDGLV